MQLIIEYSLKSGNYYNHFAIDDIQLRPGRCVHQHDYIYTFTDGIEDLSLQRVQPIKNGDNIDQVYDCHSKRLKGVPQIDHTTNSADGSYFLFMNHKADYPTTYIDTISMLNLPRDRLPVCVRFAYQSAGDVKMTVYAEPFNDDDASFVSMPLWTSK